MPCFLPQATDYVLVNHIRANPAGFHHVVDPLARIIVGITGGVFLLVPIIVMTFVGNPHWRLVVVSVAILWFAISVAVTSKVRVALFYGIPPLKVSHYFINCQKAKCLSLSARTLEGEAITNSISTKATNQELLGATAAYTAVLVVYVGSTSGSG